MPAKHCRRLSVPIFAALLLLSGPVFAQSQPVPAAPEEQNKPERFDERSKDARRNNETLSERLDQTGGVIKPPVHIDPEIHETPPPTGDREIVIPAPPPGTNPEPK